MFIQSYSSCFCTVFSYIDISCVFWKRLHKYKQIITYINRHVFRNITVCPTSLGNAWALWKSFFSSPSLSTLHSWNTSTPGSLALQHTCAGATPPDSFLGYFCTRSFTSQLYFSARTQSHPYRCWSMYLSRLYLTQRNVFTQHEALTFIFLVQLFLVLVCFICLSCFLLFSLCSCVLFHSEIFFCICPWLCFSWSR